MYDTLKRILSTGVEVQNKMIDFLDELVQKGKIDEEERKTFVKEIHEKIETSREKGEELINDICDRLMERSPFVAKKELEELRTEVRNIRKHLNKIDKSHKEESQTKKKENPPQKS
jgi:polyhydroxyalkanoate synthesis regulator phasin